MSLLRRDLRPEGRAPASPYIDFNHRRQHTTSPVRPEVEKRYNLEGLSALCSGYRQMTCPLVEDLEFRRWQFIPNAVSSGVRSIDVLLVPAEFQRLPERDLSRTVCVVFDILRATSTMLEAFANGAAAIRPAVDIPEALAWHHEWPDALLAGEREGLRIGPELTGGIAFDLGNSPREFTAERVRNRRILMTTSNGTRALRACQGASAIWIASFGNLTAVADRILWCQPEELILVCSGTLESLAYEDVLGAGALIDRLGSELDGVRVNDSAHLVRHAFESAKSNLLGALTASRNGRRLLSLPELAADVPICLTPDRFDFVPEMDSLGVIRRPGLPAVTPA